MYPAHLEVSHLVQAHSEARGHKRTPATFPLRSVRAPPVRPLRRLGAPLLQRVHGGRRAGPGEEQARGGRCPG